jgi:L-glyceraldehyde 3-phosphate reductase
MLTSRYLNGVPQDSRASQGKSLLPEFLNENSLASLRSLNAIAEKRGQTLAQMAIAWVLRNNGITTALIGASKPEQIIECAGCVNNLEFTEAELNEIDEYAKDQDINLWAKSSEA